MSTAQPNYDPLPVTFSVQVHPNLPHHVLKARHSRGVDALLPPLQFGPDGQIDARSKRVIAVWATDQKRNIWARTFAPARAKAEKVREALELSSSIPVSEYDQLNQALRELEDALECPQVSPNDPSLPTAVTYPMQAQSRQDPQPQRAQPSREPTVVHGLDK